jgi:hypothetical protein
VEKWEYKGFKCMAVLNEDPISEVWCGYVGVPRNHPCWGKDYEDVGVWVHGGLTFSQQGGKGLWKDPETWWFGFDCAHAWDDTIKDEYLREHPDFPRVSPKLRGHKWTFREVKAETNRLARQLRRKW